MTWLKYGLKERNGISLKTVQNNSVKTNYIEAIIDYTQKKNKYRLCGDRVKQIKQTRHKRVGMTGCEIWCIGNGARH